MVNEDKSAGERAKPRQRRKDQRPGEIIEAGFAEFAAHGFEATRLEDVAARAGVAKGTIYRYFESKEVLFEAVVRARISSNLEATGVMLSDYSGSAARLLEMIIGHFYDMLFERHAHALMRILISEGPRFPRLTEFYHREVIQKGTHLVEQVLRIGIEQGEFREGPMSRLPMVIFSPGLMAAVWQLNFQRLQPVELAAFRAAHVDMVLNGLIARQVAD